MKKTSKCLGTFRWPIMWNDGNAVGQPVSAKLQKIVQLKMIFKFCFIIFQYKCPLYVLQACSSVSISKLVFA